MDYKPKTVSTDDVVLSEDLLELTEFLARNTHDTWATERYSQGWKYGPNRDDQKKLHPCLIPYEELPESEKVLDRKTAMETLKTILSLGYSVEVPLSKFSEGIHKNNKNLLSFLKSENLDLKQLYHIWKEHDVRNWARDVELYVVAGEKSLEYGEPLLAYNMITEGQRYYPQNIRLMQLQGLSLARIGASEEAKKVLAELFREHNDKSEETLGMLGRTYKDLAGYAQNNEKRLKRLKQAITFYGKSFELYESIWAGVNLASLYLLIGEKEKARKQASKIIELCQKSPDVDYWLYASIGESFLVQEDYKNALKYYNMAVKEAKSKVGVINTTRKNALIVMRALGTNLETFREVENCLSVPKIIIFTGHRIDAPSRENERFPLAKEKEVYKKILEYLSTIGPAVGYSSAANGADILFLEAMKELGNPCNIVLPYNEESFIKQSVHEGSDTSWEKRYFEVTRCKDNTVYELKDQSDHAQQNAYSFANSFILGMAKLKANQLETLVYPFAVWNSDEASKDSLPGGTTYTIKRWYRDREFIELIDLKNLKEGSKSSALIKTDFTKIRKKVSEQGKYQTKGILFSDTVDYTSLSGDEFIKFEETVLEMVEEMSQTGKYDIQYKNTWGDALHMIFNSLDSTVNFAVDLNDKLLEIDWKGLGFKRALKMRVAIHAGQVIETVNPITKVTHYSGTNVCRAARLEPLTPPGQVYCTQEFAALMLAEEIEDFKCLYVGDLAMPKGYGIYPIFNVRRAPK